MLEATQTASVLAPFLALASLASAQAPLSPAGTIIYMQPDVYTRGGAGQTAAELMQRFDADDLHGFGIEVAHPGMHVIHGVSIKWRDFGSLPDGRSDFTIYGEDPQRPNYPDLASPLGGAQQIQPQGTIGIERVLFSPPVLVPEGQDVFVGVRINPPSFPFGGIAIAYTRGTPGSTVYDLPGPALPTSPPEAASYRILRDVVTDQLTYMPVGQYGIDLLVAHPSGFATTISMQPSIPASLAPPGATTMLSGLHPDARNPPRNAGRADDVGFVFQERALGAGALVFFLGAFADFGPTTPLNTLVPGSRGALCLAPSAETFAIGTTNASGAAWHTVTIPAALRLNLAGFSWTQQAVGIDPATSVLLGTQCVRQRF